MTKSHSVDVSDSLEEARTRLLRSARALNRTWAAGSCLMVLVALGALVALLFAVGQRPVDVVIWSVLLAATGYNLTRFWPRDSRPEGVVLDAAEATALREVLDPDRSAPWPDTVVLTARPDLELDRGRLALGLPLLACLEHDDLAELWRIAARAGELDATQRSLRWARRLAGGDVGRSLIGRRRPRPTRLGQRLAHLVERLETDVENWRGAGERATASSGPAAHAVAVRDQVADAWGVLHAEWLVPAAERGRWHVAPFTGLRRFVEGADLAGWLAHPGPRHDPSGTPAALLGRHERAVAETLASEGQRPIAWADHPLDVTLPQWRVLVAEVLDAGRRAARDHEAPTLATLLALLESGAGPALADATARDRGLDPDDPAYAEWSARFVPRVLAAGIGIAAVDAHPFALRFTWPAGTELEHPETGVLPIEAMTAEVLDMVRGGEALERAYAELRTALDELGLDLDEPLWLDPDGPSLPERPLGSFVARQGLVSRLVVVTDRALHVLRNPDGPRLDRLVRRADPRDDSHHVLRAAMVSVWQGDTTDEVATIALDHVTAARFGPAVGGFWWRLRVADGADGVSLRGRGEGEEAEAELATWLGERLETPWRSLSERQLLARHWLGRVGVPIGALALASAVVLGLTVRSSYVVTGGLAMLGFAGIVAATLPDLLIEARDRWRQRASSPTGTAAVSVFPAGASGQAHAASYAQDGA